MLNDKEARHEGPESGHRVPLCEQTDKEIFLKADSCVPYGFVVTCMGIIREAGVEKVNIVTKPLDER